MVNYDEIMEKLSYILALIQKGLPSGVVFLRIDWYHKIYIFTWQEHDSNRCLLIEFTKQYSFKQIEKAFYPAIISKGFIEELKSESIYKDTHPVKLG